MPEHRGPDLREDRDLPKYDYIDFMEKMISGDGGNEAQKLSNGKH